jgi:hypothetical protein
MSNGFVTSNFCVSSVPLAQFEEPVAIAIATELLKRSVAVSAPANFGGATPSTATVTYTKSAAPTGTFTPPKGYLVLADKMLAHLPGALDLTLDPWAYPVKVLVTNDPTVIGAEIGPTGSKANLFPIFPVPVAGAPCPPPGGFSGEPGADGGAAAGAASKKKWWILGGVVAVLGVVGAVVYTQRRQAA